MRKSTLAILFAAALLLGLGLLVWNQARPRSTPKIVVTQIDAAPPRPVPMDAAAHKIRRAADAGVDAASHKLSGTSPEFSRHIDETVPNRFRAAVSECDRRGFAPDLSINIEYQLHIRGGQVSATNVRVAKSNLGSSELEQCMVQAVLNTRWIHDELPDFTEESDLFIRLRSLDKYADEDEQRRLKEERRKDLLEQQD